MNYENGYIETPQQILEKKVFTIFLASSSRVLKTMKIETDQEKALTFLETMKENYSDVIYERKEGEEEPAQLERRNTFLELLKRLADYETSTSFTLEGFNQLLAKEVSSFLSTYYTANEIDVVFRKVQAKQGYIALGNLLTYRIRTEKTAEGDTLSFHLPITVSLTASEIKKNFFLDLGILAHKLVDELPQTITNVRTSSWIILKHKQGFEKLGFTVTQTAEEEEEGKATARINKEEFINLFKNTTE